MTAVLQKTENHFDPSGERDKEGKFRSETPDGKCSCFQSFEVKLFSFLNYRPRVQVLIDINFNLLSHG